MHSVVIVSSIKSGLLKLSGFLNTHGICLDGAGGRTASKHWIHMLSVADSWC